MNVRYPQIIVNESVEGVVSFQVVNWMDAERVFVYPSSSSKNVEVVGDVGESVSVRGAESYCVVAEGEDGERVVVLEYTAQNGVGENVFEVESQSDMTVERAKERYVDSETWILELENELEAAMK